MRVLITDQGVDRSTLAVARALGCAGWDVGVGAPFRSLAARSRHVRWSHEVPAAQDGVDAYVEAVARAAAEGRYDVVFPVDDVAVIALSERRADVGASVPYGPHRGVVRAFDKLSLASAAAAAGLEVPRTYHPVEPERLPDGVPLVVKARLHVPARFETMRFSRREDAAARAREIAAAGAEPFVQEVIDGTLLGFAALVDRRGRIVARSQQEAQRVWPPGAGVSVRDRIQPIDEELASRIEELLRELEWFGLAHLQFIHAADGGRYLIDLNGRFYGSIALALAAGVNYAAMWAELAVGREVAGCTQTSTDVRFQWLGRDLKASLHERRSIRNLIEPFVFATRSVHSVWTWRDPWPAISYFARRGIGAGSKSVSGWAVVARGRLRTTSRA